MTHLSVNWSDLLTETKNGRYWTRKFKKGRFQTEDEILIRAPLQAETETEAYASCSHFHNFSCRLAVGIKHARLYPAYRFRREDGNFHGRFSNLRCLPPHHQRLAANNGHPPYFNNGHPHTLTTDNSPYFNNGQLPIIYHLCKYSWFWADYRSLPSSSVAAALQRWWQKKTSDVSRIEVFYLELSKQFARRFK